MAARRRVNATIASEPSRGDAWIDAPPGDEVPVMDLGSALVRERAGEPLRVCLACGEEDPGGPDGPCPHTEVAAFAEASSSVVESARRLREAWNALEKGRRALSTLTRGAVADGGAVIDERAVAPVPSEPAPPCPGCLAREVAMEADEPPKARPRKVRKVRSCDAQASFTFAATDEGPGSLTDAPPPGAADEGRAA
jgi:hypothetical protein